MNTDVEEGICYSDRKFRVGEIGVEEAFTKGIPTKSATDKDFSASLEMTNRYCPSLIYPCLSVFICG
jgi:hypothetical protein